MDHYSIYLEAATKIKAALPWILKNYRKRKILLGNRNKKKILRDQGGKEGPFLTDLIIFLCQNDFFKVIEELNFCIAEQVKKKRGCLICTFMCSFFIDFLRN